MQGMETLPSHRTMRCCTSAMNTKQTGDLHVLNDVVALLIIATREIIRTEIAASAIAVGQIVQVKMQLRLLRQDDGKFAFRELLKGICVLHDGLSTVRPSHFRLLEGRNC